VKIGAEIDDKKRNELIREAFRIHQDDIGHIPLHQQALAWGFSVGVRPVQLPTNHMYFKWVVFKPKAADGARMARP
jgi:peptide/nickel transport system substrate-binding protein